MRRSQKVILKSRKRRRVRRSVNGDTPMIPMRHAFLIRRQHPINCSRPARRAVLRNALAKRKRRERTRNGASRRSRCATLSRVKSSRVFPSESSLSSLSSGRTRRSRACTGANESRSATSSPDIRDYLLKVKDLGFNCVRLPWFNASNYPDNLDNQAWRPLWCSVWRSGALCPPVT